MPGKQYLQPNGLIGMDAASFMFWLYSIPQFGESSVFEIPLLEFTRQS